MQLLHPDHLVENEDAIASIQHVSSSESLTKQFESCAVAQPITAQDLIHQIALEREDDTAFFVCDLGQVCNQVKIWRQHLPQVHPFYAVKCNPEPGLLKMLASLGLGFDCASKAEIDTLLRLGVDASRLLYANPCKQASHIKFAASHDVMVMTFDSEGELKKVKKIHPKAQLVLRLAVDDSASQCRLGMKFGASVTQALSLLKKARDMDLEIIGVSFHVGSGCGDPFAFDSAIKTASYVMRYAHDVLGMKSCCLLDIGGGFPGVNPANLNPMNENESTSFEEIAKVVQSAIDKYITDVFGKEKITVVAEPGRFFASAAYTLATCVISVKEPDQEMSLNYLQCEESQGDFVGKCYINDGVYGSFNCLLFDHAKVSPNFADFDEKVAADKMSLWSVWGPSCDGLDQIADSCALPSTLTPGNWLYFQDMGAYTMAASSTFNGFPQPCVARHFISRQQLTYASQHLVKKPWHFTQMANVPMEENVLCGAGNDATSDDEQMLQAFLILRTDIADTTDVAANCQQLPVVSF